MKPSVCVLLCTYNGEKYLKEQLDSVFAQKDVDVTILAHDDGSSDGTLEILNEYGIKVIGDEHYGPAHGFMYLMQNAPESEYYAFCDQDDVWDVDKLSIAINAIKKYKTPALYYSGQRLVDEKLNFIEDHTLNKDRNLRTRFVLSDFAGCTGVFNKKLIEEVIRFEPKYVLMHDTWILRVCLCLGGNVVVDSEPRMNYRQHSGNTVGLGHSFKSTVKQVKQYLGEYKVEQVTRELVKGYGERMVPEYKEVCDWICGYKSNKKYRRNLLDKNNVDFCKSGLNITYWIKVNLHRL